MAYFQTDDRNDYFESLRNKNPTDKKITLTNPLGVVIFEKMPSWKIRMYYKENHAPAGCNGKRIWREELKKLGYTIT